MTSPIGMAVGDIVSSIISLDKLSAMGRNRRPVEHMELLVEPGDSSGSPDSDYNSANDDYDEDGFENEQRIRQRLAAGQGHRC